MRENSPVIRHWKMLKQMAESPMGKGILWLANHLGVCVRTVQRDLATLRQLGVPVHEEVTKYGKKKWLFDHADFLPCGISFTYDEVTSLYIGYRCFTPLKTTVIGEAMESALKKVHSCLGPGTVLFSRRMYAGFQFSCIGWSDYSVQSTQIDRLMIAIEESRMVQFDYQTLQGKESLTVWPYCMSYQNGSLYLTGRTDSHSRHCIWKVDRIGTVSILNKHFTVASEKDKYRPIPYLYGMFSDETDRESDQIVLRLDSAKSSRFFTEHRWNDSQQIECDENGQILLRLTMERTSDLVYWLLSFGHHVQVVSPESLKLRICSELEELRKKYRL